MEFVEKANHLKRRGKFFKVKKMICTLLLSNKKKGYHAPLKEKEHLFHYQAGLA